MSNTEKYRQVFVTVFGVDESALNEGFTFKDVEAWDSLNGMEILKNYGVEF